MKNQSRTLYGKTPSQKDQNIDKNVIFQLTCCKKTRTCSSLFLIIKNNIVLKCIIKRNEAEHIVHSQHKHTNTPTLHLTVKQLAALPKKKKIRLLHKIGNLIVINAM